MKKRIVIASVLKPVNDTRMTGKIATTLSGDENLDVHVIGYPAQRSSQMNITFHPLNPFARLSFKRMITPFRILKQILHLKPSILIVATHELLLIAWMVKVFLNTKIIYDVQENYYLNVLHTNAFPKVLRSSIGAYVRLKERIASHFVDHFFLAEQIYQSQLPFLRAPFTVLENKAVNSSAAIAQNQNPSALVFSGTLSKSTGVFKAITLAEALHKIDQRITLTIIGYAPLTHEYEKLAAHIKGKTFITIIGGTALVPHSAINDAVRESAAGIIAYEDNPSTAGRVPTKLFEYLALNLSVILYSNDLNWELRARKNGNVIQVSDPALDAPRVHEWLKSTKITTNPSEDIFWKNEENKLKTAISSL